MPDLPAAVSTDQHFYAHHSEHLARIADAIDEQNELLRQVLAARQADQQDAIEEPAAEAGPVAVKLREPEPVAEPGTAPAALREPEPAPSDDKKPTRTARGGRRTKASS
jgi:hypothetical protein